MKKQEENFLPIEPRCTVTLCLVLSEGILEKSGISLAGEDPAERCASELNKLGKLAYEALLDNHLFFSQDEVKSQPTVDFLRVPFLSRKPSVSKIKPTPCYAFTHKTFQEYFAAFYLAHQLVSGVTKRK